MLVRSGTQEHCSVAGIFVQSYNYITPRKDPFCRWTSLAKSQSAEIRKIAKFYNEGQRSCCCTYKLSSVEGLILQSFSPLPPLEHTLHKFVDEMKYGKWTRRKIEKNVYFLFQGQRSCCCTDQHCWARATISQSFNPPAPRLDSFDTRRNFCYVISP